MVEAAAGKSVAERDCELTRTKRVSHVSSVQFTPGPRIAFHRNLGCAENGMSWEARGVFPFP